MGQAPDGFCKILSHVVIYHLDNPWGHMFSAVIGKRMRSTNIGFQEWVSSYKSDNCQTLDGGTSHLAVPIHTTFIDHSSVKQF